MCGFSSDKRPSRCRSAMLWTRGRFSSRQPVPHWVKEAEEWEITVLPASLNLGHRASGGNMPGSFSLWVTLGQRTAAGDFSLPPTLTPSLPPFRYYCIISSVPLLYYSCIILVYASLKDKIFTVLLMTTTPWKDQNQQSISPSFNLLYNLVLGTKTSLLHRCWFSKMVHLTNIFQFFSFLKQLGAVVSSKQNVKRGK